MSFSCVYAWGGATFYTIFIDDNQGCTNIGCGFRGTCHYTAPFALAPSLAHILEWLIQAPNSRTTSSLALPASSHLHHLSPLPVLTFLPLLFPFDLLFRLHECTYCAAQRFHDVSFKTSSNVVSVPQMLQFPGQQHNW